MAYETQLVDTMEKWKDLASDWNNLLAGSRSDTVFLTWEWLSSWAECFLKGCDALFIIAVRKDGRLIGIAPWYICNGKYGGARLKQVCFLGFPESGSDYLDVFAEKGREREVANILYNYLNSEAACRWDSLCFSDMPSHSLFYLHFYNRIDQAGKFSESRPGSFCPTVVLPTTEEEYFNHLSANRRQQFNRHMRLLRANGEVKHTTGCNDHKLLKDFFSISGRNIANDNLYPMLKIFIDKSMVRNWVQIDLLSMNGGNAAGLFHLCYGGEVSMFLMNVDHSIDPTISIGNLLVGLCIGREINRGTRIYDFLKGDEAYKFHWANSGRRSLNLFFPQKSVGSTLVVMNKLLKSATKTLFR